MKSNSETTTIRPDLLSRNSIHWQRPKGVCHKDRSAGFGEFVKGRRDHGIWPYGRVTDGISTVKATMANDQGRDFQRCLNFGSQDYLGLALHPAVLQATREAIDEYGIHSAGSPALTGRTMPMIRLEKRIAGILETETAIVFPTGWAAGFGVIAGLAHEKDTVVIDALSHNCLQEGAKHATEKVRRFKHNDLEDLRRILAESRAADPNNGLFVVIESLYSMDSDSPDLKGVVDLCREFAAISILDVAHDFGSMGTTGRGLLDTVEREDYPDLVMGSFSKTFGCNGGFVACTEDVKWYLQYYSSPTIFSNAHSPLQSVAALKCFDIAFSDEGKLLREQLMKRIGLLRSAVGHAGFHVAGEPSPIVPVYVGTEKLARLTSREFEKRGLVANLVEFPAVPKGKARFRLQLMATHSEEDIRETVEIMSESLPEALKHAPDEKVYSAG